MARRGQILKAALWGAVAVVFVLVVGVALAPAWINLQAVRSRVSAAASSALGGAVAYERIDLSWLPRPEAVIRSADVSVPGVVRGKARTVRVAFAFLPLLKGRFVPSRVTVDGLDVFLSRPDGRGLWVEGVHADASPVLSDAKKEVAVSHLEAESPKLALAGTFRWDPASSRAELSARGSLDGEAVRTQLLAFAGDDRTISEIFGIFRGGRLTSFTFESVAPSPLDLFALERMTIRAKVEDARLRIEGPGLDLRDVSADVALEGGVLSVEGAKARLGGSRAESGRVLVGLARGDGRLRVEAQVRADLAETPAVLARAVRSLREPLALVSGVSGSARGKLVLGDCAGALGATVVLDEMRFSGSHARIPWPVEVHEGRFSLEGSRLRLSGVSGAIGRSTFSKVNVRVDFGRRSRLEEGSGSVDVSLGDFLEGARASPAMSSLTKSVSRLGGVAHVQVRRLEAPLAQFAEASLDASGTFEEILFEGFSLPRLLIASGRFAVDDEAINVTDAALKAMDAHLRVSGSLEGWRGRPARVEASLDGDVGPEAVRNVWERASLPAAFRPAAPVALRSGRLGLDAGGAFTLAGDFTPGESGPRVTLDLSQTAEGTDVPKLSVADGDSAATIALRKRGATWDIRFQGRLDRATVAKLFEEKRPHAGAIEGDFHAVVPIGNPGGLTAEGRLRATDLDVPTPAGTVTVEHMDARLAGRRFDVASSSFIIDGQRLSAVGRVTSREGGVALDLDSLSFGKLKWEPVVAEIHLAPQPVTIALKKADLCGVTLAGSLTALDGGKIAVQVLANSSGEDVSAPLACLGIEGVRMTGRYEASLRGEGEGVPAELPGALHGPATFHAFKGGIGKATALTRLLTVLNTTDVFGGKSRVGDAVPYDELSLDGELADGRLLVREATLKSPAITMAANGTVDVRNKTLDVKVLSHPLSTIDKAVQAVPVVREVFKGDFLTVAAEVKGPFEDPKIRVTPARDVGKGLVNIMQRTVALPVKVLDPKSQ